MVQYRTQVASGANTCMYSRDDAVRLPTKFLFARNGTNEPIDRMHAGRSVLAEHVRTAISQDFVRLSVIGDAVIDLSERIDHWQH